MSRGVIACSMMGRTGNQMFQWAYCKSYAERNDLELQTDPWIGQRVFGLNDPPIHNPDSLKRVDENTIQEGMTNILYRSYSQQQKCLTYTRKDCLRWFQFTDEIREMMSPFKLTETPITAHYRRGDYEGYKYPMVSHIAYNRLQAKNWPSFPMMWISEETRIRLPGFEGELADVVDFYIMAHSLILIRANSSFSWWAGTLNHGAVYSPIMDGLEGGKEHDVEFVRGNWPKFRSDLPFLTDLHLKEE